MCSMAKTRCMKDGRKILDGHCGDVWERCGSEFKAHNEQEAKSSAMEKKEDLVDLKSNPHRMWPMCSMAKNRCMKDGEKTLEGRCEDLWKRCGSESKAPKEQERKNGAMEGVGSTRDAMLA